MLQFKIDIWQRRNTVELRWLGCMKPKFNATSTTALKFLVTGAESTVLTAAPYLIYDISILNMRSFTYQFNSCYQFCVHIPFPVYVQAKAECWCAIYPPDFSLIDMTSNPWNRSNQLWLKLESDGRITDILIFTWNTQHPCSFLSPTGDLIIEKQAEGPSAING